MNIKELSDSKAPLDIELSTNQGKKRLAVIIVISAIIVITVVAFFAFGGDSSKLSDEKVAELYKEYVEPIISNNKLICNEPDPMWPNEYLYEYHSPSDGLGYSATHNKEDMIIQTQVIQSIVVDENMNTITDHYWNLIYRYEYGSDISPQYTAWLDAEYDSDNKLREKNDMRVSLDLLFDSNFNILRITGFVYQHGEKENTTIRDLTDNETTENYEKYKDELYDLRQKLYDMFGEEHFRR